MRIRLALAFALVTLVAAMFPTVAGAGMHDGHDQFNFGAFTAF
jgi:hypothetical protein